MTNSWRPSRGSAIGIEGGRAVAPPGPSQGCAHAFTPAGLVRQQRRSTVGKAFCRQVLALDQLLVRELPRPGRRRPWRARSAPWRRVDRARQPLARRGHRTGVPVPNPRSRRVRVEPGRGRPHRDELGARYPQIPPRDLLDLLRADDRHASRVARRTDRSPRLTCLDGYLSVQADTERTGRDHAHRSADEGCTRSPDCRAWIGLASPGIQFDHDRTRGSDECRHSDVWTKPIGCAQIRAHYAPPRPGSGDNPTSGGSPHCPSLRRRRSARFCWTTSPSTATGLTKRAGSTSSE